MRRLVNSGSELSNIAVEARDDDVWLLILQEPGQVMSDTARYNVVECTECLDQTPRPVSKPCGSA